MPRLRSVLVWSLKLALGVGILIFMTTTKRLDLSQLAQIRLGWAELSLIGVLFAFIYTVAALRWRILLRSQGIELGLWRVLSYSMIGNLFNTVIPGSVSGDLIKAYYIGSSVAERRARAVTTVLVDRIVGLLGMLMLAAIAGFVCLQTMTVDPKVETLVWTVTAFAGLGVVGFAAAVLLSEPVARVVDRLSTRLGFLRVVSEMLRGLSAFRRASKSLVLAVVVGWPAQLCGCLIFYVLATVVDPGAVPFAAFVWIVPLGYTVMALPIAPMGIGVGQLGLFWLFNLAYPGQGALGTVICTAYQILSVLASLTGLVFYLLERRSRGDAGLTAVLESRA